MSLTFSIFFCSPHEGVFPAKMVQVMRVMRAPELGRRGLNCDDDIKNQPKLREVRGRMGMLTLENLKIPET